MINHVSLLRSNVEFAKRIALDRFGDPYVYGGQCDPFDLGQGADCSGLAALITDAVFRGPDGTRNR